MANDNIVRGCGPGHPVRLVRYYEMISKTAKEDDVTISDLMTVAGSFAEFTTCGAGFRTVNSTSKVENVISVVS